MLTGLGVVQEMVLSPPDHLHPTPLSDLHRIVVVTVAAAVVEAGETGTEAVGGLSTMIVTGTGLLLGLALKRGDIEIGMTVTENATIGILMQIRAPETRETIVISATARTGPSWTELHMNHRLQRRTSHHRPWHPRHHLSDPSPTGRHRL